LNHHRLFVAIDLPREIAERAAALDPHFRSLVFSPPEQIHLTLAFFDRVDLTILETLKGKLATISFRAFFLPLVGLGTFSRHGQPHILWLGVDQAHPHLFQLHKRVNEAALACGLPIEERAWKAHFTIARSRGVSKAMMNAFLKKHRDFDGGMFRVEEFHLYESKLNAGGPIHRRELTVRAS